MNSKISDFKLAELIIKKVSKVNRCPFVDMRLCFDDSPGLRPDCLVIDSSENIGQTIYKIVQSYVDNYNQFSNKELFNDNESKDNFFLSTAAFLRHAVYAGATDDSKDFHALRLYQKPFIWSCLKNLICPIYHKQPVNYQVVTGSHPTTDVAVYVPENSVDGSSPEKPFVFLNMDIGNKPVSDACLLLAAIEGLDLEPQKVLRGIFSSTLSDKFAGIVKLAFSKPKDREGFMFTLFGILGYELEEFPEIKLSSSELDMKKQAQYQHNPFMWWYFGVIEKLLEPSRGSDWTTYESLEPEIKNFWDKVEEYKSKKKRSADGVAFDQLLRLKQDQTTDATKPFNALLSHDRIW